MKEVGLKPGEWDTLKNATKESLFKEYLTRSRPPASTERQDITRAETKLSQQNTRDTNWLNTVISRIENENDKILAVTGAPSIYDLTSTVKTIQEERLETKEEWEKRKGKIRWKEVPQPETVISKEEKALTHATNVSDFLTYLYEERAKLTSGEPLSKETKQLISRAGSNMKSIKEGTYLKTTSPSVIGETIREAEIPPGTETATNPETGEKKANINGRWITIIQ